MALRKQTDITIALNRRARFDYEILESFEAGIVLVGSEVKSLRQGRASIGESFAGEMSVDGCVGLYLMNANISEYPGANQFNHDPRRPRKLLVHKRQMNKMLGDLRRKGVSLVPLSLYFNSRGLAKLSLAIGKGKKNVDKRETIKERDWQRDKSRLLRRG